MPRAKIIAIFYLFCGSAGSTNGQSIAQGLLFPAVLGKKTQTISNIIISEAAGSFKLTHQILRFVCKKFDLLLQTQKLKKYVLNNEKVPLAYTKDPILFRRG